MSLKIAVVGSGISGLVSAYLLSQKYEVHLFEANDTLGGHTHTVKVNHSSQNVNIDCGFIVFNKKTYPHFTALLEKEHVAYEKSEMSFSYFDPKTAFYYNGHSLNSLFSDKKNFFKSAFYRMLFDIVLFNRNAKSLLKNSQLDSLTLQDYLQHKNYSPLFINTYLIPMISAIWSAPKAKVPDMPLAFLLRFYENHGLLDLYDRPDWYVIKNGSNQYIPKLIERFKENIHLSSKVDKIVRKNNQIAIVVNQQTHQFDKVIIAAHSDDALKMLEQPTDQEIAILGDILYEANHITLHTDIRVLPPRQKAWASWNYYENQSGVCTLNYYANRLQNMDSNQHYIVSVNLEDEIAEDSIIKQMTFSHPVITQAALKAQKKVGLINGQNNTYFCGAYWGYGFHEDGVQSALAACADFKVTI